MRKNRTSIIKTAQTDLPLARDTLAVARQDLDSAICLYEQGYYPQALFFLQQGVEKGWKAYGYHNGVITLEQARTNKEIGHKGSKVANKSLLRLRNIIGPAIQQVKIIREIIDSPQTGESEKELSYLERLDNDYHWAQKEIDKITGSNQVPLSAEIKKRLDRFGLDAINEQMSESIINSSEFGQDICNYIRENAIEKVQILIGGIPTADTIIQEGIKGTFDDQRLREIILYAMKSMIIINPLFYLAIITQEHENQCRYPEKGRTPLKVYSHDHPLIANFPGIAQTAQESLTKMNDLFQLPIVGGL
ncbi:hypothetical protein [Methanocalculus sp.]|uniref:hypothetical protein n=1 Tax=Methanocalculus sp. TaxID=2004547 RepID=UPI002619AAA1|nr:hypothetical protein [Methanocalculus sp.]MDG6250436.1 hypothetical protein [Methanocalculus sp.]